MEMLGQITGRCVAFDALGNKYLVEEVTYFDGREAVAKDVQLASGEGELRRLGKGRYEIRHHSQGRVKITCPSMDAF